MLSLGETYVMNCEVIFEAFPDFRFKGERYC